MAKPIAVNPKQTVVRRVLSSTRTALMRSTGALLHVQVSPKSAITEAAKLEEELKASLLKGLASAKEPVFLAGATLPEDGTAWLISPMVQNRNAAHALPWYGCAVLYVKNGRPLAGGIMLSDMEEPLVVCAGEGASGAFGRARVSGRADLADAMVTLPRNSGDGAKLKLLELADTHTFHTRKTGAPLVDIAYAAMGQVDVAVATRTNTLEAGLMELLMAETGGKFTEAAGATLAGAPKVVTALAGLLK